LETASFDQALNRLEEIAEQVRRKDVSLEDSLDLLEESVRLASVCNQQIDYTAWLPQEYDEASGDDVGAE
jgi:exodeoxyribonuclease VII small subunit